jgi:hypothetical protein
MKPVIKAKRKLIKIGLKVLWTNAVVRAFEPRIQI